MTSRTLPGVGVSNDLELRDGHTLSIVTRLDGGHELRTGDAAVALHPDEAAAVARLLGTADLVTRMSQGQRDANALLVEQVPVPPHSPYAGDPLSATRLRGRTGASVVAVLRGVGAQPSPKPEFVLEAGDLLVTVGTREALDHVVHILDGTG